ncbi:Uncharacterised protein [Mycobacteroides abscessus subsp. massiliense]|nr:Uncharacterised protein [Mycobacteroides abscessus subsp. massiliense]
MGGSLARAAHSSDLAPGARPQFVFVRSQAVDQMQATRMPNCCREMIERLVDAAWRVEHKRSWRNIVLLAHPNQRGICADPWRGTSVFTASADPAADGAAAAPAQSIVGEFLQRFVCNECGLKVVVVDSVVVCHVRLLLRWAELMSLTVGALKCVG